MLAALESPSLRAAKLTVSDVADLSRYAIPLSANPLISLFGVSLATLLSSTL